MPADRVDEAVASVSALRYRPCVGITVLNRHGLVWASYRSTGEDPAVEPALQR